jgi:hypothetical protein
VKKKTIFGFFAQQVMEKLNKVMNSKKDFILIKMLDGN